MSDIEDYASQELGVVEEMLFERYKRVMSVERTDTERRLDPDSTEMTVCPTPSWQDGEANFVVLKLGKSATATRFSPPPPTNEHDGTRRKEYDDIGECVAVMLRLRADHQREKQGVRLGVTGADLH